jgi:cardiolipin synthase
MSVVHVAVPMLRGRRHFKVEKGRRWSVVEHLMLDAVADEPASAAQLSKKSNLPRRIVVEAFIRLMRVGWVEITPGPDGPIFRTTSSGLVQADAREMQAATVMQYRWMAFSVDRVAGSVFRGREVIVRSKAKLSVPAGEPTVFLEPSVRHSAEDMGEVYSALENDNELIVGADSLPEPLFKGYGVFEVRDGAIDSLPGRARDELKDAILQAAGAETVSPKPAALQAPPAEPKVSPSVARYAIEALFDHDDLVLGGDDHRSALETILGRARQRAFIHSTFATLDGWKGILPILLGAASKGVKIQIFWGQDDDSLGKSSSRDACEQLSSAISAAGRSDNIVVHPFTTGSHAKFLVGDDGQGGWSAILGSCNWLSADFESFDASLRLRDPKIVGELMRHLGALSVGPDGIFGSVAGDLTVLGRRISLMPRPPGRTTRLRVLLAPDHADLVLDARDRSTQRMVVTSHRIGIAGKPLTIFPAMSAAQAKHIKVSLYYGRPTDRFSGKDAAALALEIKESGVDVRPIHRPRLHAKVLAWDDDALAVTSLNWLSKDPSESALRDEIGIFVEMNKIADNFVRRFEQAKAIA